MRAKRLKVQNIGLEYLKKQYITKIYEKMIKQLLLIKY